MQISKAFWIPGVHFQAGKSKDKKTELGLFQVIQQATDRGLPSSQADSRPVTLLNYNDEGYLRQLSVSAYSTEELLNLTVN